MKLHYRVAEKSGMLGGRSFVASLRVELDTGEQAVRSNYGVYARFDLPEKFQGKKGVDITGMMDMETLLGRGVEAKFPSIQMATDFVDYIAEGLKSVKSQIELTKLAAANLNRDVTIEIG